MRSRINQPRLIARRFGHRLLSAAYKTAHNQFAYIILEVAWCPCRLSWNAWWSVPCRLNTCYVFYQVAIDSPDCIIEWCIQEKGMCSIDRFLPSISSVCLRLACIYVHAQCICIYPSCGSTSLSTLSAFLHTILYVLLWVNLSICSI